MSQKIVQITENRIQEKSAQILKKNQEDRASKLKTDQNSVAHDLRQSQVDYPEQNIQGIQIKAAIALKQSQKEAATALEESQGENAEILKNANARATRKLKDKDQIITYLTGEYSIHLNGVEEED
jgi:hypothetical protein